MTERSRNNGLRNVVIGVVVVGSVLLIGTIFTFAAVDIGTDSGSSDQAPFVTTGPEAIASMRDNTFAPDDLTIDVGATVTWTNADAAPHDAVSDDDEWETDLLQEGDEDSVTFDEVGVFTYHCSVHPHMEGTITVR